MPLEEKPQWMVRCDEPHFPKGVLHDRYRITVQKCFHCEKFISFSYEDHRVRCNSVFGRRYVTAYQGKLHYRCIFCGITFNILETCKKHEASCRENVQLKKSVAIIRKLMRGIVNVPRGKVIKKRLFLFLRFKWSGQ